MDNADADKEKQQNQNKEDDFIFKINNWEVRVRRNVVSLGNQAINGDIGKVYAAGEVNIVDADVEKLNGAGEINIENSHIEKTRVAGTITANNSTFGTIKTAGEIIFNGLCKADTLKVIGRLEAEQLECRVLCNFSESSVKIYHENNKKGTAFRFNKYWDFDINCSSSNFDSDWDVNLDSDNTKNKLNSSGGSVFEGKMKAETFENLCDFNMDFEYQFKNVLSIDPLHASGILECEELYSFGILDMEGVNADTVYIHPYAESKLQQVMGSDIMITEVFPMDQTFEKIPKSADQGLYLKKASEPAGMMAIDSIEGDIINLDYVQAKLVSGQNVTIGDYCIIDRVEYIDSIQVSPKASVKEMVQL